MALVGEVVMSNTTWATQARMTTIVLLAQQALIWWLVAKLFSLLTQPRVVVERPAPNWAEGARQAQRAAAS